MSDGPGARGEIPSYPLGVIRSRPRVALAALPLIGALLFGACTAAAPPSFDATAPCTADARLPGAYPALEALVPARLFGAAPDRLDSGRNCSVTNLGTLAGHGLTGVRFAGGLWQRSTTTGVTLAVFEGGGLSAERLGEWYEASARLSSKTAGLKPSRPIIAGRQGYRLDLLASEAPQTVICWPSADGASVQVVIGAGVPESDITAALAAFGG